MAGEEEMKDSVQILGKTYSISVVPDDRIAGNMGSAKRSAQTIVLNETLHREQMEETLLHEVLHIIDGELCCGLDEDCIARLAVGLYSAGARIA
jgi:hypothetical protein